MSQNHRDEFWHVDKQNGDCFQKYRFQITKTKGGGIIIYIAKFLKARLRDDFNCFPDSNIERLRVKLSIQKKKCVINISYYSKKTCKMFLEKLALGIDLAMTEGKFVILAGDYNLNYFARRKKNMLQSVVSPCDLKPSNKDTASRLTNFSSILIDYILTDHYETGISGYKFEN